MVSLNGADTARLKRICRTIFLSVVLFVTLGEPGPSQGQEWITTSAPFTNWSSIACSFDATKIAACVNGGGIYFSPNFGETWNKSAAPDMNWACIAVSADGARVIAGTWEGGGVWMSSHFGTTWNQTSAPTSQWTSIASSEDGMIIIAASIGKVYVSRNGGGSWDAITALGAERKWNRGIISSDGTKMAVSASGSDALLALSSDSGVTWRGDLAMVAVAASKDASRLYASNGVLYYSTNLGESWLTGDLLWGNWRLIVCSADGSRLMALGDDLIHPLYISADGGAKWAQIESPAQVLKEIAMSADGSRFVALATGEGIYTCEPLKPLVTVQPFSQTILAGTDATMDVAVGFGIGPFDYQWRFNGGDLPGETNRVLKLSNLTNSQAGEYSVMIRNDFGIATSRNGVITVQPAIITGQPSPVEQTVPGGVDISFNVTAVSMVSVSYQWQQNGTNIVDATNSTLTLHYVNLSHTGSYAVSVSNSYGTVTSRPASLTVVPAFVSTLQQDSSTIDAILNGDVTPGLNETVAWFEWGPTMNLELRTTLIQLPQTTNPVRISALITNLVPYTDYYFRAVASNSLGKIVGLYGFDNYKQFRAVPRFVRSEAPQVNWTSIACSSNGARVIAAAHNYYGDQALKPSLVYISTNFGVTWETTSAPNTNWNVVASSAEGDKLFAAAGHLGDINGPPNQPIYTSRDFGKSWQQIVSLRAWRSLACSADGSTLIACSDSVFISHDSGETWQQTSMPSGLWQRVTISADGQKMAASKWSGLWREAGTIWVSTNSGGSWKTSSIQAITLVSARDGSKLFANGYILNPPAMSTDWGATWTPVNLQLVRCAAATYDGSQWFISSYYGILCSGDSGTTWGPSDDQTIVPLSIACSSDAGSVYAIDGTGSIFTWRQATPQLSVDIKGEGTVVSWPSHRLSSRLQENSTLNPIDWADLNEQPTLTNRIFRYMPRSPIDKTFYRLKTP